MLGLHAVIARKGVPAPVQAGARQVVERTVIRAAIDDIQGSPPLKGTFNENVVCDSLDTRRSRTGEAVRVAWLRSSTLRVGSGWSLRCRPCPRRDGTV